MFVVGQRVRVRRHDVGWANPAWGDPHFIVGHFGHVAALDGRLIDVRISHGPDGGAVAEQVLLDRDAGCTDWDVWPMLAEELEPVD
jgi:hypothetical protein